jgi:hypothetical protein
MWCPDHVDYVEFNIFPDDPDYMSRYRSSLIAAAWAKGGNSTVYHIDPIRKSLPRLYQENIQVSPHELLHVLRRIEANIISTTFDDSTYKPYKHKYWHSERTYNQQQQQQQHDKQPSRNNKKSMKQRVELPRSKPRIF